MSTNLLIWAGALLTLCVYSFLYRDNPFYKFAEHLMVGVGIGYTISIYWHNAIIRRVWRPLIDDHQFFVLIPTILGLLMFTRFIRKYSYLSRWPIAFYVGIGAGMAVPSEFQTYIFEHLQGTIPTVITFSAFVMVVGVIATLVYFFFSAPHRGALGRTGRVGIYFIMTAFGAAFGYTVMARVSLLIGRLQFLLHDWLGIIK